MENSSKWGGGGEEAVVMHYRGIFALFTLSIGKIDNY